MKSAFWFIIVSSLGVPSFALAFENIQVSSASVGYTIESLCYSMESMFKDQMKGKEIHISTAPYSNGLGRCGFEVTVSTTDPVLGKLPRVLEKTGWKVTGFAAGDYNEATIYGNKNAECSYLERGSDDSEDSSETFNSSFEILLDCSIAPPKRNR